MGRSPFDDAGELPEAIGEVCGEKMSMESRIGGFAPCRDAHAIESATIGFYFDNFLTNEGWAEVRKAAFPVLRAIGLESPQPFFGVNVTFEQGQVGIHYNSPPPSLEVAAGLSFARLDDEDNPIERVIIARNTVIISTFQYVRWLPFRERAHKILGEIFEIYKKYVKLSSVKVEYWDKFVATSSATQVDLGALLNRESKHVAQNAANADDMWHSYYGLFNRLNENVRRLVNVRLDYVYFPDAKGEVQREMKIYTSLQDSLNEAGYEPVNNSDLPLNRVLDWVDDQHHHLKLMLSEIITPTSASRIGL
jgi:uncharacterized protein (TIGR04255 family)